MEVSGALDALPLSLFRSEEMQLMQLLIPAESAHQTITALGEVGMLQFKDLNADKSAFQRTYANQIKRCDDMARQLRFFTDEVEKAGVLVAPRLASEQLVEFDALEPRLGGMEECDAVVFVEFDALESRLGIEKAFDRIAVAPSALGCSTPPLQFVEFDALESRLGDLERELTELNGNSERLNRSYNELLELQLVLERAASFFEDARAHADVGRYDRPAFGDGAGAAAGPRSDIGTPLLEAGGGGGGGAGAFSSSSGGGGGEPKSVQLGFVAGTIPVEKLAAFERLLFRATRGNMYLKFAPVGAVSDPASGEKVEKAVFVVFFAGERAKVKILKASIARYREANPGVFTIVTFPFLFAVMFGDMGHGLLMLMFAGWLIAREKVLGRQDLGDILGMMFGGRYVILLMALFSIYTGLLYNEVFSIVTDFFGPTAFACATDASITNPVEMRLNATLCPSAFKTGLAMTVVASRQPGQLAGSAYPVGVDPAWHGTRTELPFLNSMKMKLSIILGVVQMNLGVILSYFNQRYFSDTLSTLCEFIPQINFLNAMAALCRVHASRLIAVLCCAVLQMIFLNAMFGYLCFLIILKWASGSTADLYHILIYMFLDPTNVDCNGTCKENQMFAGQMPLQVFLLVLMFVSVPWMLLPKPLILKKRHEAKASHASRRAEYGLLMPDDNDFRYARFTDEENVSLASPGHARAPQETSGAHAANGGAGGGGGHGHEEFEFGEVMVHQMIHTIEFVLGAVSNTASYLRLWALSLAHSQLSAVFYDRVLMAQVAGGSPITVFIAFFVFACATGGVLMVMESLSAFLHALRLHWVEFQNKFYHGDGYQFVPFSFALVDQEKL
ncbi:hypothetical protein N2152v2_002497 [Parachlorella kessleri]